MASMSIGLGLTNLRRYNFNQAGLFYSSLYLITTGLERLLKIIIIYDHRINNCGKFPNNSQLKNFGHNIGELFVQSLSRDAAFPMNTKYLIKSDLLLHNIHFF
jgi:hypothetical protein